MKRPSFRFREATALGELAFHQWRDDRAPRMGAALAYYVALSVVPSLVILLAITGWVWGSHGATREFVSQIQGLVGYQGAQAFQDMLRGARHSSGSIAATVLGLATVFVAASAAVTELRDALDIIWHAPAKAACGAFRNILNDLKDRLRSLALVLASGLYLVMSFAMSFWILTVGKFLNSGVAIPRSLTLITDWVISFVVTTALLAFIFKVLPRVPVLWSDVALGAVGTSLLFVAGKVMLDLYIREAGFTAAYGAAGSLIVVLVWVYYSSQIVFLGAEFTRAYALRYGSMFVAEYDSLGLWQTQRKEVRNGRAARDLKSQMNGPVKRCFGQ